jgi:ubiquitin-protein ligase
MDDSLRRIIRDIKDMKDFPIEHIAYEPLEDNIRNGYALIRGPDNTPYQCGYYLFKIDFPSEYPFKPPIVTYKTNNGTTRFNPNFYRNGKVCLSILNTWPGEKWSSCQTLRSVLLSLQMTLCETPLLNEPGFLMKTHNKVIVEYDYHIEYANYQHALAYVYANPQIFKLQHEMFGESMRTWFSQDKERVLLRLKQLIEEPNLPNSGQRHFSFYDMTQSFDYNLLYSTIQKLT